MISLVAIMMELQSQEYTWRWRWRRRLTLEAFHDVKIQLLIHTICFDSISHCGVMLHSNYIHTV